MQIFRSILPEIPTLARVICLLDLNVFVCCYVFDEGFARKVETFLGNVEARILSNFYIFRAWKDNLGDDFV